MLLSVSAKRPHKNLARLIGAIALIPAERQADTGAAGLPDLVRGRAAPTRGGAPASPMTSVSWAGSAQELEGLWAIADAFVFPSLYEGFGLPVLEAMARGVPVACSSASWLPEVAGEAALLFDPQDERAIAAAVERLSATLWRPTVCVTPDASGWPCSPGSAAARLTLDSYARALAAA